MSTTTTLEYSEKELELLTEFIDETTGEILYPENDGNPMSEHTTHFQWITTIQGGLDSLFAHKADVFVAGDLLWYPVEGKPFIRVAPDVMVAFGRPKKERGSYEQWKEENIAPQVVMEILSKGNTAREMMDKFLFYQRYGVKEYYVYDFKTNQMQASIREEGSFTTYEVESNFLSPLLGVRFDVSGEELQIFNPNGTSFLTYLEQDQQREQLKVEKEEERRLKEEERKLKEEALIRETQAIKEENKAIEEREKERAEKEAAFLEIQQLKALLKEKGGL